jgi:hypothetical protein
VEIDGETADGGGEIVMAMERKKIWELCTAGGVVEWSENGEESRLGIEISREWIFGELRSPKESLLKYFVHTYETTSSHKPDDQSRNVRKAFTV